MVDRSPFVVIESIVQAIANLSPGMKDEAASSGRPEVPTDRAAVWDAFTAWKQPEDRAYVEAIRRSRHSYFYYLQHEMFNFGTELTGRTDMEFSAECGREFMKRFFVENVFAFLQVALAKPGDFQATAVDVLRMYMHRYTGPKFVLTDQIRTSEIVFTLRYGDPDEAAAYFDRYGLAAPRCFANSFCYIAACFDQFLTYIVEGYGPGSVSVTVSHLEGVMRLPVKESDGIDYGTLIGPFTAYVQELAHRKEQAAEDERLENDLIVGSEAMRHTWERIRRASRSVQLVLLRGESGTGKSFIARKIHELSDRRKKAFIEVGLTSDIGSDNMVQSDLFGHEKGAFTGAAGQKEGLFSLADGGTIFLDEIGDASPEMQAKLLRVIESSTFKRLGATQDIKVDVRVIAATNRELEKMVDEGAFRRDLYYRLNVIPIELPPLRERPEDIPALAEFLLARAARDDPALRKGLAPGLAEDLRAYSWPGNVRELDHALKYAAAMAEGHEIRTHDLPEGVLDFLEKEAEKAAAGTPPSGAGSTGEEIVSESVADESVGHESVGRVIDEDALRRAIRASDPVSIGSASSTHDVLAHIDHAKRVYLRMLIRELQGDLPLVAKFWDRSSEKTLRKLVETYGLTEELKAARSRARSSG